MKVKAGDIFTISLPGGTMLFGRIILNVCQQVIRSKLVRPNSPLTFFADTVLQRILRGPALDADPLLPPLFTWRDGEWELTGHQPIAPETVDFPQYVSFRGAQPVFVWGELRLPIALTHAQARAIGVWGRINGSGHLGQYALFALGRSTEIDSRFTDPAMFDPGALDLRGSLHAEQVHGLLGSRIGDHYFETALRYGFDVRRFYGPEHRDRELLLCPYCRAPFDALDPICPTCSLDTRDDALTEITAQRLADEPRMPCQACASPILRLTLICPGCGADRRGD
jgi:hypothetical protein